MVGHVSVSSGSRRTSRSSGRTLLSSTQAHLLHALRQYEQHYNAQRPHRGISNASPLQPLPDPIIDPDAITRLTIRRRDRLGGTIHEYEHAA